MNDELSWRHDPRVALALRRDLDRYARHATVDYDAGRGLARLTASLAVASAAASAAPATTGLKALAAKALTVPGFKVLAVCVAAGAASAAGTVAAVRIARESPVSIAPAPPPARALPPATPPADVHVSAPAPAPAPPASPEPETVLPESLPLARPSAPKWVAKVPPPAERRSETEPHRETEPPSDRSSTRLRDEMTALVHLREVATRDPAAAVALAAEDDARYGSNDVFAEEREAIAVIALAQCDRMDDARTRGRTFLSLHPKSPFAARVRGLLAR